ALRATQCFQRLIELIDLEAMSHQLGELAAREPIDGVLKTRRIFNGATQRELLHEQHQEADLDRPVVQRDHRKLRPDSSVIDDVEDDLIGT
ncbi:MAG TPA: hypothetical protein DEG43_06120, partial [Acidimicrobiaceae bacterium]|nr:hypothetical protein [Acidimicrobiaceae bacterium]